MTASNTHNVVADYAVFKVLNTRISRSDNTIDSFNHLDCRDWVNVVAFDKTNRLLLTKQYRAGVQRETIELPGGLVDDENPLESAKSELVEECGVSSNDWIYLGWYYPNPALQNNKVHAFHCSSASGSNDSPIDNIRHTCWAADVDDLATALQAGHLKQAFFLSTVMLLRQKAVVSHSRALKSAADYFSSAGLL